MEPNELARIPAGFLIQALGIRAQPAVPIQQPDLFEPGASVIGGIPQPKAGLNRQHKSKRASANSLQQPELFP
jgi:hypothetical protein